MASSVDLRSLFGPARSGSRPTCLAFAASDAHAALRDGWVPLSCEYVFYHAQKRANRSSKQGALLSSMLEALRHDGQPSKSGWPYLQTPPSEPASWSPPSGVGPLFRRASQNSNAGIKDIIAELEQGQPVIILMMLSPAFYNPSAEAIVHPGTRRGARA